MIKLPTETEIEDLQSFRKPHSLSIYAPYIAPNSSDNPNRIQIKNLLKEARQLLLTENLDQREINEILQPAEDLIETADFRYSFEHSLAMFIQPGFFWSYDLPNELMAPSISLGKEFVVRPILNLIEDNESYYLLILSHNGVQLLEGDYYNIEKVKFQKFPTTLKRELNIDEYPKGRQPHTVAPAITGKGSEKFHGQYNKTQVDKNMLIEFFRRIDRKLHKILRNSKIPLIIAGVDYLLPLYRRVNTYPHILADEIRGSLEHDPLDSIRTNVYQLLVSRQ